MAIKIVIPSKRVNELFNECRDEVRLGTWVQDSNDWALDSFKKWFKQKTGVTIYVFSGNYSCRFKHEADAVHFRLKWL